ncbi:hypothetical protein K2173_007025 [Erythroxylum novogranatense]|uniref:SET domain-containing protein n=1 Tax=Erythroxylum novogranatense TaxID=1862640 RepID=A0AAV8SLE0_9ROSI|nr:hypothetical protein K2173_007025 [Erythroxylum novogranatense]
MEQQREAEGDDEEKLKDLLEWAAKLGVSDSPSSNNTCLGHSLSVSYFPDAGGRGLGAVRQLRKGELILRVPKSALITTPILLQQDQTLSFAIHTRPSLLSSTQILTVCLLYEVGKGNSSRWFPYLLHLPRTYLLLSTFTSFHIQALQVDDAIWAAEKTVSKAKMEWVEAKSLMQRLHLKPQLLTFKAWLWASSTISSRTLHIPWDEAGCLCPVGDLFNYAAPGEEFNDSENLETAIYDHSVRDTSFENESNEATLNPQLQSLSDGGYNEDIASYCFYARKTYKRGQQVLLSYGTYTNLELLEHYGFILNHNPNDKVFIPLELNMYSCSQWPRESMYINQDGKPSYALLCALRLWATPPSHRRLISHLAYSGSQLSEENEVSIMKWISNKCHTILNKLPTTIEQDSSLLAVLDKTQNLPDLVAVGKVLCSFGDEASSFLEANNLHKGNEGADFVLSSKFRWSLERWKLAVQWRLRYKKTLIDCICNCKEVINSLSCNVRC